MFELASGASKFIPVGTLNKAFDTLGYTTCYFVISFLIS